MFIADNGVGVLTAEVEPDRLIVPEAEGMRDGWKLLGEAAVLPAIGNAGTGTVFAGMRAPAAAAAAFKAIRDDSFSPVDMVGAGVAMVTQEHTNPALRLHKTDATGGSSAQGQSVHACHHHKTPFCETRAVNIADALPHDATSGHLMT